MSILLTYQVAINALFQISKFGNVLYLMRNLTQSLTFAKFDIQNNIVLKNNFFFFTLILNFGISTSICYYMRDALINLFKELTMLIHSENCTLILCNFHDECQLLL